MPTEGLRGGPVGVERREVGWCRSCRGDEERGGRRARRGRKTTNAALEAHDGDGAEEGDVVDWRCRRGD